MRDDPEAVSEAAVRPTYDAASMPRLFRLRMRHASFVTLTPDDESEPRTLGRPRGRSRCSEQTAAFLVRGRVADVTEVYDPDKSDHSLP